MSCHKAFFHLMNFQYMNIRNIGIQITNFSAISNRFPELIIKMLNIICDYISYFLFKALKRKCFNFKRTVYNKFKMIWHTTRVLIG